MSTRESGLLSGHTRSLRLRLTVWVVAVFILIQGVIGGVFWWFRHADSNRLFRDKLVMFSETVAERVGERLAEITEDELSAMGQDEIDRMLFSAIDLDIVDRQGRSMVREGVRSEAGVERLLGLLDAGEAALWVRLDDALENEARGERGSTVLAGAPLAARSGDALVVVTTTDGLFRQQSDLLARIFLSAGLLGVAASAISGWLIAGIAVAPLRRLTHIAEQLHPETIDDEINVDDESVEIQDYTQELDDARERFRDAFAAQERFLSNVSHEIKTPIAMLLTQAQVLDRSALTQSGQDFVESTEDEMRRLGQLVESFLTLTRVRNGGKPTRLERYPVNELAADASEDSSAYADEYGVRLRVTLDDADGAMEACVNGDPVLLRTLLGNLIRNAVRFSPADGVVEVRTEIGPDYAKIGVRDHGVGLSEDIIPKIFDRFVQSDAEADRERGQGLGLAISKGIAELHDGDVLAGNHPEGGAVFTVRLPISRGS